MHEAAADGEPEPQPPSYLFTVLSPRGVQALNEVGGVAQKEGIACGAADHRQHSKPHVR